MKQLFIPLLLLVCLPGSCLAATLVIAQATGPIAPTNRGAANTTFFGWELFGNDGDGIPGGVVNDTTPDIGSATGVRIITTNGEDHTPFSAPNAAGNIYTFNGTLAENVTVSTMGIMGTGFTSLFIQGMSAPFGNPTYFSGTPTFSSINGVSPVYVSALNKNGIEQFGVRYDLPGNEVNYTFSMTSSATHFSLDKLVIDTIWSATSFDNDVFAIPEPSRALLLLGGFGGMVIRRRRASHIA